MKHKLQQILKKYEVKNIIFDSRTVNQESAFFAIKGYNNDGNEYIDQALEKGAKVVFSDNPDCQKNRVYFLKNIRLNLALAAGIIYPELPKQLIAVTGTNGKSSIVSYVHQILSYLQIDNLVLGTIGIESTKNIPEVNMIADNIGRSNLTTMDPVNFRKLLHIVAENKVDYAAFEASSHGLHQRRLGDIKVTSAAFSSFSQDHLEYHKTMEEYLKAKLILFSENLADKGEAVVNSDMMFFDQVQQFFNDKGIKYCSVGKKGDISFDIVNSSLEGQLVKFKFLNKEYEFETDIIGSFQVINILIAARLVNNLGIKFDKIINILPNLRNVKGRLQRVTSIKDKYQIFVDYAHTPDALEKTLMQLNDLKQQKAKLYVVFGCGGDRDKTKRLPMGQISSKIADYVIVTDDNPRTEDANHIREDIIAGCENNYENIADREKAINYAINKLNQGDILLVAGKGHEDYQIIGKEIKDFSDIEVIENAIK